MEGIMNKKISLSVSIFLILSLFASGGLAQGPAPIRADPPDLPEHVPGEILIAVLVDP